jgi:hypothetical protein
MPLNEFTELVKQIRLESPGLTYREAQIRAKLRLDQEKEKKTTDTVAADPVIITPQFTVPGIKQKVPDPIDHPAIDVAEIEKIFRSGTGRMYLISVMRTYLGDRNPELVIDGKSGVNTVCHIEYQGLRIPADPGDFFKYFG